MAMRGGGDHRRPDGSSTRFVPSTSDTLEQRLAEALEAAEHGRSVEGDVADTVLGSLPAENAPAEPVNSVPTRSEELRTEAAFEETAVLAAYLALRGEIGDRLEALHRAEEASLPPDGADPMGAGAANAFRQRIAESLDVLRRHRARLQELRASLASWRSSEPR